MVRSPNCIWHEYKLRIIIQLQIELKVALFSKKILRVLWRWKLPCDESLFAGVQFYAYSLINKMLILAIYKIEYIVLRTYIH